MGTCLAKLDESEAERVRLRDFKSTNSIVQESIRRSLRDPNEARRCREMEQKQDDAVR